MTMRQPRGFLGIVFGEQLELVVEAQRLPWPPLARYIRLDGPAIMDPLRHSGIFHRILSCSESSETMSDWTEVWLSVSEQACWLMPLLELELTEVPERLRDDSWSFELTRKIILGRGKRLSTSSYGIFSGSLGSAPMGRPRSSSPCISGTAQDNLERILVWRIEVAQAFFVAFGRRKVLLTDIGKQKSAKRKKSFCLECMGAAKL